jgi:hypothetical protein
VAGRDRPPLTDPVDHRELARSLNRLVWDGLAAIPVEPSLPDAAHASLHHWRQAGGPLEEARGEWLVSHVYAVLGRGEPALHHARRSYDLCVREGYGGFDIAYAYEGMARALACAGDSPEPWRSRAAVAAAEVADEEDRSILLADLIAEPWYGH